MSITHDEAGKESIPVSRQQADQGSGTHLKVPLAYSPPQDALTNTVPDHGTVGGPVNAAEGSLGEESPKLTRLSPPRSACFAVPHKGAQSSIDGTEKGVLGERRQPHGGGPRTSESRRRPVGLGIYGEKGKRNWHAAPSHDAEFKGDTGFGLQCSFQRCIVVSGHNRSRNATCVWPG
jgi:hypothetical protein